MKRFPFAAGALLLLALAQAAPAQPSETSEPEAAPAPTALDAELFYQLLLGEINATGTAIVMATHDLDLVRHADCRTIELNRGQIVYDSAESPEPAA